MIFYSYCDFLKLLRIKQDFLILSFSDRQLLDSDSEPWVVSQMDLGSFGSRRSPLEITVKIGVSPCVVRKPISINFFVRSLYHETIDLSIKLDTADAFMFAGSRQVGNFFLKHFSKCADFKF